MKNILSLVLLCCSLSVFGQSAAQSTPKKRTPLPNSLFNLDVNYAILGGPIFGIKSVIGSNNSGFLVGFQFGGYGYYSDSAYVFNSKSLRIGYQGSVFTGIYWTTSIDLCSRSLYDYNFEYYGKARGYRVNLGVGYTLSVLKSKRLYLNSEFVLHVLDRSQINTNRIQASFGIGYRIGTPATTTYEGVKNVTTVPVKP
jgi:hypothetical protein